MPEFSGKILSCYGVISSPHKPIAYQRITSCLEIRHQIVGLVQRALYWFFSLESSSLKITACAISSIGLRESMLFF